MIFGNKIVLKARIVSLPPPTGIQWRKNNEPIAVDGIKFSEDKTDERMVKLVISDVDFDDSGKYSILVTNAIDSDDDEIQIEIKPQGMHILFTDARLRRILINESFLLRRVAFHAGSST